MTPAHAENLRQAIADLADYFGALDAAIGIHGISYASGGDHVFAEKESHELHMRLRNKAHRDSVSRRTRIERNLLALSPVERHTLSVSFTPRRWEWSDARSPLERQEKGERSGGEAKIREAFASAGGSCLLGLALELRATREAYLAHEATRAVGVSSPSQMDLLRFLEWQVSQSSSSPVVQKIRNASEALLTRAIESYEAVRVEDRSEELEARERARARMAQLLTGG